jgi:RNA polymerase sigma factor (sigma-70 family)
MRHEAQKMPTDNQLMLQVRDGDMDKLGILFERYKKKLFNYFVRIMGNRNISEDLVQEVFFRIMKYRDTYKGKAKFAFWIYKIAHNVHIDHYRKQGREEQMAEDIYEPSSNDPLPEEKLGQLQDIDLMRAALARLSEKKREILILSRYHDLKYDEIAQFFGCRTGTIKVHVHRAIKDLGKIYSELSGGKTS